MIAARQTSASAPVDPAPCPTAEMALAYLRQPNATRAQLYLRRARPHDPARPCGRGDTGALRPADLRALAQAPRLSSSDPQRPALGRWQEAKLAHERRFGPTPSTHGAARPRGERTRPVPGDASAPLSPLRPGRLTVEVGDPAGGAPWRGRYHLVVIDGEVLLFPRRVDDPAFRFRTYAGREAAATASPTPTARAVEAALWGLVQALQAQLDATNRDGAS